MGWKERAWYLPESAAEAFDSSRERRTDDLAGRSGGRRLGPVPDGQVHLHYFEKVAAGRRREIDERVADLKRWVGETRFTIRFPGAINKTILG